MAGPALTAPLDGSPTRVRDLPPTVEDIAEVARTALVTVEPEIVEEVVEIAVIEVVELVVELHAGTYGVKEDLST